MNVYSFDMPVRYLKGVGTRRAAALARLGITSAGELLYHFPRGHRHTGDIKLLKDAPPGEASAFCLTVATQPRTAELKRGLTLTKFTAFDDSGKCTVTFFNRKYAAADFEVGQTFRFWGRLSVRGGGRELASPEYTRVTPNVRLPEFEAVYPLSEGLTQKFMRSLIAGLLRELPDSAYPDPLPAGVRQTYGICGLAEGMRAMHTPASFADINRARDRFVFEELYRFALNAERARRERARGHAPAMLMTRRDFARFTGQLPYALTGAQVRAIREISADLRGQPPEREIPPAASNAPTAANASAAANAPTAANAPAAAEAGTFRSAAIPYALRPDDTAPPSGVRPMNRLLSGDVGSGKTICAAAAAYIAAINGCQCALMAPTEILARQHYRELSALFARLGCRTALLVGALKKSEKEAVCAGLADGSVDLVVGTHALLSEQVRFARLGLVITDEQHRFGLLQRRSLAAKGAPSAGGTAQPGADGTGASPSAFETAGGQVHVLIMSATPIPRTLALILYGDTDISLLDERPPGRQKVDTFLVNESHRQRLNAFIRKQAGEGGRVYIVCPAVDAADEEDDPGGAADGEVIPLGQDRESVRARPPLKSAVACAAAMRETFPDLRVGFVHGRMKSADKDEVMDAFARGDLDILVATTVIEVGINVPEATLMIVENAERFGLSQLHQLRGRVGRGRRKACCVLVTDSTDPAVLSRLEVLRDTEDGFRIAQYDLETRGPGDFIPATPGDIRQHGALRFRLASLCGDMTMLQRAFEAARLSYGESGCPEDNAAPPADAENGRGSL